MNRSIISAGIPTLLMLGLLIGLGLWQIERLHWKRSLIAQLTTGLAAPARDYMDLVQRPEAGEFAHVSLTGKIVSKTPLLLYGRTLDGVAGEHVLCVVETDKGRRVLLDRGFVSAPDNTAQIDAPLASPVDGVIRLARGQHWFEPDNNPVKNQWYWVDIPAIEKATGIAGIDADYVEALRPTGPDAPTPTMDHVLENIPNNHLQYAITWFGLAATLLCMYTAWVWQQLRRKPA